MNGKEKTTLMDETAMARAIMRISHEIIERNKNADDVALIGIVTRGDRKSTRLNSSHTDSSRMPSSA